MNRVVHNCRAAIKKVTHVVFDLDGTLLDTEPLYDQANENVLNKYGKSFSPQTKVEIMGLTGREKSKILTEIHSLPITWEEYYRMVMAEYPKLLPNAVFCPDTELIYRRIFTQIAATYGKTYTNEAERKIKGRPELDGAVVAVKELKLPLSPQDFLELYKSMAAESLAKVAFTPGAEKLIRHLHQQKIPIAVATSSTRESYDLKTSTHKEVFSLFHHIVAAGNDPEVKHGKPSPDCFLVCASRFPDRPNPADCLVFEDAPNGVQAAVSAGMQCIAIPDDMVDTTAYEKATLILKSLEDTPLEKFGLPPFN